MHLRACNQKEKKPLNKMRKLILLTILSLLLISCKNDNNKNPGLENSDQLTLLKYIQTTNIYAISSIK